MGKLEIIVDNLNAYLIKNGLQKMQGNHTNLDSLYESALRSIWKEPDGEKRENLAVEIAVSLRKYFGGKTLDELHQKLVGKLNAEEDAFKTRADQKSKEERMKDPNYVPSFDELFNEKK